MRHLLPAAVAAFLLLAMPCRSSDDRAMAPQPASPEVTAAPSATPIPVPDFWIGVNNFALASASDVHTDCGGPAWEQQLDAKFATWRWFGVDAVRFWAFQSYAIDDATGARDWTSYDRIFAKAREYGVELVPVLGNDGLTCDWWGKHPRDYKRGNAGTCSGHWYDAGYKRPYDGYLVSYRAWVTEIVSRYASSGAVKVWEIINEPNDICADVIDRFFLDVTAVVRASDPSTPISLGASGRGESWTSGDGYRSAHENPHVTWASGHDYGHVDDPFPISPSCEKNCMRSDLAVARDLGKPFYIGEAGIDECDTPERAEKFRSKIVAMRDAGVTGFVLWDYQQGDGPICDEAFGPRSPIMKMIFDLKH